MVLTTAIPSPAMQNTGFDTSVNGHEYLLSIIQLPIYLQLNLSRTKQLKTNTDGFPRRRQTVSYAFHEIIIERESFLDFIKWYINSRCQCKNNCSG
jgi:hypothetical protein